MAGRIWLDAVLELGPEWGVVRVECTPVPKELAGGRGRALGEQARARCPN